MQPELEKLQGVWNVVSLEVDGEAMPVSNAQIVVKQDAFESLGMGAIYQGRILLDTKPKPWAIDMKFTAGPEKGNLNRGIFELKGDSWRLCLQMTGGDRPERFSTKAGGGLALEVLERASTAADGASNSPKSGVRRSPAKSDSGAAKDFPTAPVPELAGEWAMVACVMNGRPLEPEYVKMGRRMAQGNETTIFMGEQPILQARYAIDRRREPNTMDYLLKNGKLQHGIFKLEGDRFEVAFGAPGQARPEDFVSLKGDGRTVATWKLVKR